MVTGNPAGPEAAERLPIVARATTVKGDPLLAGSPGTVTTTLPVAAPVGTGTVICESLHTAPVAVVLPNLTVLEPCVAPKPPPKTDNSSPTEPDVCDSEPMDGEGTTVKLTGLLKFPLRSLTTILPVVAPDGTGTTILPALMVVGTAAVPLNVTVLFP